MTRLLRGTTGVGSTGRHTKPLPPLSPPPHSPNLGRLLEKTEWKKAALAFVIRRGPSLKSRRARLVVQRAAMNQNETTAAVAI